MRKILVLQHVAYEILGTLDPLLKSKGFRIRYVNFDRHPHSTPTIDRYDGLVVLGGYMGVYEAHKFPHLRVEMRVIEEALKKNVPILGICLGSQLLAHVLGANVRKHTEREMGWYHVQMTEKGQKDPLFSHFQKSDKVFQSHGDTFDIPKSAIHLASSELCVGQAFRYGEKAYGMQFHLEVDQRIIHRWLNIPVNVEFMRQSKCKFDVEKIEAESKIQIHRSMEISQKTFTEFTNLFGEFEKSIVLDSGHGKPKKSI